MKKGPWPLIVPRDFTAGMMISTDFLIGVLTAIILYAMLFEVVDPPQAARPAPGESGPEDLLAGSADRPVHGRV